MIDVKHLILQQGRKRKRLLTKRTNLMGKGKKKMLLDRKYCKEMDLGPYSIPNAN